MSAAAILFSNIHDSHLRELARLRAIASVPFGGRYRLIDFTLSNMVNSDISDVYIIAASNYQSLMNHIGSGKDWDLARRNGGVKILPPFITAYNGADSTDFSSRLEGLKRVYSSLTDIRDEFVVLSDCDVVCNVDLTDMIEDHAASGADITIAVRRMNLSADKAKNNVLYSSDSSGRIIDVSSYPARFEGEADVCLNICVMRRDYMLSVIEDAIAHDYKSFTRDIISRNLERRLYRVYRFDGYFETVSSFEDYFRISMQLVHDPEARRSLFWAPNRPVYTRVRNSTPTYYAPTSTVRNSLIADGCIVEGEVENSILFRGVHIGKHCKVRNSILMRDTLIEEGVTLNCVICDKMAVIKSGKHFSGCDELPYYISKGKLV